MAASEHAPPPTAFRWRACAARIEGSDTREAEPEPVAARVLQPERPSSLLRLSAAAHELPGRVFPRDIDQARSVVLSETLDDEVVDLRRRHRAVAVHFLIQTVRVPKV